MQTYGWQVAPATTKSQISPYTNHISNTNLSINHKQPLQNQNQSVKDSLKPLLQANSTVGDSMLSYQQVRSPIFQRSNQSSILYSSSPKMNDKAIRIISRPKRCVPNYHVSDFQRNDTTKEQKYEFVKVRSIGNSSINRRSSSVGSHSRSSRRRSELLDDMNDYQNDLFGLLGIGTNEATTSSVNKRFHSASANSFSDFTYDIQPQSLINDL